MSKYAAAAAAYAASPARPEWTFGIAIYWFRTGAGTAAYASSIMVDGKWTSDGTDAEEAVQLKLVRDIFGNPFKPVTIAPAWLTSTVVSLAQAIYDERAFDRMPVLADALEESGCTSQEMLEHCRGGGEHVRGCWLVDLVLGKE